MQFQILGPLRVTDGHEHEIALGGAKPAAVLAMLLLRANEVVSADHLIEDLWDGQPPATAPKTLQVHISRLRRVLGEDGPISTSRGGYILQAEPDQIDARRFQKARGDLEAAEQAARTAARHVQAIQSSDERAETLLVLARVLAAAGQEDEARDVAAEALAISETRENVVLAQQARDMLGAAAPVATA